MENPCPNPDDFIDVNGTYIKDDYDLAMYIYSVDERPIMYTSYSLGSCVFVDDFNSFSYDFCSEASKLVNISEYSSHDCNRASLVSKSARYFNDSNTTSYCNKNDNFRSSNSNEPLTVFFSCVNFGFDGTEGVQYTPISNGEFAVRSFFDG